MISATNPMTNSNACHRIFAVAKYILTIIRVLDI